MLFEVYYSADDLAARRSAVFAPIQRITVGGLLAMLVIATPIIWVLTRRLTRNARERERLLRASMTASEAERRRIARDLHDGVVQDLAGTAFSLTAVGRDQRVPDELREDLDSAGRSLRTSLKALRSLLVSIHPPDLHADGLAAALTDLTAPAAAAGIEAHGAGRRHRPVVRRHGRPGLAGGAGGGAQRHQARARDDAGGRGGPAGRDCWCSAWPTTVTASTPRPNVPRRASACADSPAWWPTPAGGSTYGRHPARGPRSGWRWRSGEPRGECREERGRGW